MSPTDFKRRQISGRGIPVPGNDIDTDRIIPARFLKAVTFETMGEHAFEDARKQNPEHPFNSPIYKGASVLVVGQNFGCGSSREHAPQALMRWGIRAVVGGAFGEIFFGNRVIKAAVPEGARKQLVGGTWDSTAVLLDAGAAIEATAKKLPYVTGF